MTFVGEIFFPPKVPEFLHVLFNLIVKCCNAQLKIYIDKCAIKINKIIIIIIKMLSCIFSGGDALVLLCFVHCARFNIFSLFFSGTKRKPAKNTGECFTS